MGRHLSFAQRLTLAGLCCWAVGVQAVEALASAGMALCLVGVLLPLFSARPSRAQVMGWARAHAPLIIFVGWAVLAPLAAGHAPTGAGLARTLDWLGVAIAAASFAALDERRRAWVGWAATAVLLGSCLAAGLQHFGWWPKEDAFAALSWTRAPFGRVYEPVPGAEGRYMAGGLLFHRLKFSNVSAIAVLWALAYGLSAQGRRRAWLLGVAAVGFASVLVFPFARAAAAALAVGAAVTVVAASRRRRSALAVGGAVLAMTAGVVWWNAPLRERFVSSVTAKGSGERQQLWMSGLSAIEAHPIAGVGLGRFRPADFAPPGAAPEVLEHQGKAHNLFITIGAEAGLVGVALFAWMLLWLARSFAARRPNGAAGWGTWAFFVLVSLTHDPVHHAPVSMALMLSFGAALLRAQAEGSAQRALVDGERAARAVVPPEAGGALEAQRAE